MWHPSHILWTISSFILCHTLSSYFDDHPTPFGCIMSFLNNPNIKNWYQVVIVINKEETLFFLWAGFYHNGLRICQNMNSKSYWQKNFSAIKWQKVLFFSPKTKFFGKIVWFITFVVKICIFVINPFWCKNGKFCPPPQIFFEIFFTKIGVGTCVFLTNLVEF